MPGAGTQFTCFTSTKVQILTPEELLCQALVALTSFSAAVLDFSAVEQLVAEVVACAQAVLKLLVYMASA